MRLAGAAEGGGGIATPGALFATGFETGVAVVPFNNKHKLSGIDSVTGSDWDKPGLFTSHYSHYSAGKGKPDPWVTTEIVTVAGHDGSPTRALHMVVRGDSPAASLTRNEMQFLPPADFRQGYVRYWLRFQDNFLQAMPTSGPSWRMFMELKEPPSGVRLAADTCGSAKPGGNNNWRINVMVKRDDKTGQPYWALQTEEVQPCRKEETTLVNRSIPVPVGKWFQVEAFYRKGDASNGRFWMAIDGRELFDFRGRTEHASNPMPIKFWSVFKLYNSREWWQNGATEQWVDDLEVFADFPQGHPAR